MLGSELWEDDFSSLLNIVKEFIFDVWESGKLIICMSWPPASLLGVGSWSGCKSWNGRNGRSGK